MVSGVGFELPTPLRTKHRFVWTIQPLLSQRTGLPSFLAELGQAWPAVGCSL